MYKSFGYQNEETVFALAALFTVGIFYKCVLGDLLKTLSLPIIL